MLSVVLRPDGMALAGDEVLLVPRVCVVQASGRVRLVEDARVEYDCQTSGSEPGIEKIGLTSRRQ